MQEQIHVQFPGDTHYFYSRNINTRRVNMNFIITRTCFTINREQFKNFSIDTILQMGGVCCMGLA